MAKRIMVCDADSGGKTGPLLVADGMTVGQYFSQYKPSKSLGNYRVSVNEQPASGLTELTEECRLNISPAKFGGAKRLLSRAGRA